MRYLLLAGVLFLAGCGGMQGAEKDDIDELFARTAYLLCAADATTLVEDAKLGEDEVWREYISENVTYEAYERAYWVYEDSYAEYQAELDRCWDEYGGEGYGDV